VAVGPLASVAFLVLLGIDTSGSGRVGAAAKLVPIIFVGLKRNPRCLVRNCVVPADWSRVENDTRFSASPLARKDGFNTGLSRRTPASYDLPPMPMHRPDAALALACAKPAPVIGIPSRESIRFRVDMSRGRRSMPLWILLRGPKVRDTRKIDFTAALRRGR